MTVSPAVCNECKFGYVVINNTCSLFCEVAGCTFCTSFNYCGSCRNGLVVSTFGDKCVSCNISNCRSCQSDAVCYQCEPLYSLSFTLTSVCISCNVSNCLTCGTADFCSVCLGSFSVTTQGTCQLCETPCLTCNVDGTCATCAPPFNAGPTANGQCVSCQDPFCITCNVSSTTNCFTCMPGYTLTNGKCVANCASSTCLACSVSNNAACTLCKPGYYVNTTTSECNVCTGMPQCLSCFQTNPDICSSCTVGFYLTIAGQCVACPSFCSDCINATSCTGIKSNIGQNSVTINGTTTLVVCDQGCMTCQEDNPVSCSVCMPGYVLVAATSNIVAHCMPCLSNCRTCISSTNSSFCTSCFSGSFLNNGTCNGCSSSCLTCPSSQLSTCTACAANGLLTTGGTCDFVSTQVLECGGLCASCTETGNQVYTCDVCLPGATMNNGRCMTCPKNCAQCSLERINECTSCLPGYYYTATAECAACPQANCLTCTEMACLSCRAGFMLSPSLTCQRHCLLPCSTCSETDPSMCLSCVAGFKFNSAATQNCEPDLDCNANSTCQNCPFGFSMKVDQNQATCEACSGSCARCNPNNGFACLSCFSGAFLNDSSCAACPSNCMMCINAVSCLMCNDGFVANQAAATQSSDLGSGNGLVGSFGEPVACIACTPPCVLCHNSPTTCLSCQAGFQMIGNDCLNLNAIGVNLTLSQSNGSSLTDADINTLFNQNFADLITGMAQAAGVPENAIVIQSLIYGSVILNTAVTTSAASGSTQYTNMVNAINNFIDNIQLSGATITRSTVVTPSDDTSGGDDDSNTTLIIAIVVPIVVVRTYFFI